MEESFGKAKYLGVSLNGGNPKWMVYYGNPTKMGDLGVMLNGACSIMLRALATLRENRKSGGTMGTCSLVMCAISGVLVLLVLVLNLLILSS